MAAPAGAWAAELLQVWFLRLSPAEWFGGGEEVDGLLRRRFSGTLEMLRHARPHAFVSEPRTALAAVLLFDQVPRNLHRGAPAAFSTDPLARWIARCAIARGWDRRLPIRERQFLYMPLMHSEAITDQLASLACFRRLGMPSSLAFARAHMRMIARFGRFPHRNPALGRPSTPAEERAVAAGFSW